MCIVSFSITWRNATVWTIVSASLGGHGALNAPPWSRADQRGEALLQPRPGGNGSQRTFQYGNHMPAEFENGGFIAPVAFLVSLNLCRPPLSSRLWHLENPAILMPVPEAVVVEDDGAVFRQNDVGFAGEGFVLWAVDREAVGETVEHRAQDQFRLRFPPADAGQYLGALLRCEDVGHADCKQKDVP